MKVPPKPLLVAKHGNVYLLRSPFSDEEDLLLELGIGERNGQVNFHNAALLSPTVSMEDAESSRRIFHHCGDDVAPWKINGTYIGANHGASEVIQATCRNHGLSTSAVGSQWIDAASGSFYLLGVPDNDTLLFLSENTGATPFWKYCRRIAGDRLSNVDGAGDIFIENQRLTQLWPACRIGAQHFTAGKAEAPVEGETVECDSFEVVEVYDIVAPDAVSRVLLSRPGRPIDPAAADLEAILRNRIVYRFSADGSCVVRHTATALRDLDLEFMGFAQTAPLEANETEHLEYLIPGTSPFSQAGVEFDFRRPQRIPAPLSNPLFFSRSAGNIADECHPPDRVVQFLTGNDGQRKVGFALGYSQTAGMGIPEKRSAATDLAMFIYLTGKIYPIAIDRKAGPVRAGQEFDCTYYRHYFNSNHAKAAGVYGG